jgi:hypothetical protein
MLFQEPRINHFPAELGFLNTAKLVEEIPQRKNNKMPMDFDKEVGKLGRRVFPCYRLQSCLVPNKLNLGIRLLLNLVIVC